jgi:hypothetical protein
MDPTQGTSKLKPGDSLNCRVEAPEPGGYLVTIVPSGLAGFLPSAEPIEIGRIVPSTFVCMNGDKALLTYAFMVGKAERVQLNNASDSENAFAVWADSFPKTDRMQRAVDLFMPALADIPTTKKLQAEEADKFLLKLERDEFTGCIKIDAQAKRSRSAALFYHGRAVGALYGRKSLNEPYRVETALLFMLEDMRHTSTEVEYYTMDEEFVLSFSAIFLGVLIERGYGFTNRDYAKSTLDEFKKRESIGCLSLQQALPCGIGFVCYGKFKGAYLIESRDFRSTEGFLYTILDRFPGARLEAYLLPDVMVSPNSMLYGYSLSAPPFGRGT